MLHHTPSIARGLDELTRVLRPGGKLFLLLYGAGGLRWKLISALRPLAGELGLDTVDTGITGKIGNQPRKQADNQRCQQAVNQADA